MSAREALGAWVDLLSDVSERWAELLDDDSWKDLPPDVLDKLQEVSVAYAEAGELINKAYDDTEIDIDLYYFGG